MEDNQKNLRNFGYSKEPYLQEHGHSVSDYGTGALGSIPGLAHILQCFFFLSIFSVFYAELIHTSYMEL